MLALGIGCAAIAASRVDLHCDGGVAPARFELSADGLDVAISGNGQWLEVEESGQVVRFVDQVPGEIDLPQPLRYGWRWRPVRVGEVVSIRRLDSGRAIGGVLLTLHCDLSSALNEQLDWLHRAGANAADLNRAVASEKLPALLAASQALIDTAVDARTRAMALHMRAMALGTNGRGADSMTAFGYAQSAWQALGDEDRALAASVGQIEPLYQTGRFASVVGQTLPPAQIHDSDISYFRVRLESTRCLAQQALGQLADADACYRWVLAKYLSLGELAEYAAVLQNYASLLRDQGDLSGAIQLGEKALQAVTGSDAAMVRGRIHVMLADLALLSGNIHRSLIESDAALDAFDAATQGVHRWQANVYLHMARLYTQLGAFSEAYDALAAALAKLHPGDAPSRYAVAMQDFAELESHAGNVRSAQWWQRAAEQIYENLSMRTELDSARAQRVNYQLAAGDLDGAAQALHERNSDNASSQSRWALATADLALRRDDATTAHTALSALQRKSLSLPEQIRWVQLQASYAAQTGDPQRAQNELYAAARGLKALAEKAGNAELRHLLNRQILPLRQSVFDLTLRQMQNAQASTPAIDTLWRWLQLSMQSPNENAATSTHAAAFDSAVAQELLATDQAHKAHAESSAQRNLLSLFAEQTGATSAAYATHEIPLAEFQSHLQSGQMLLAYLDGGERAALLTITPQAVALHPAPSHEQIADATAELDSLLQDPSHSLALIDASAQRLSALVLKPLAGTARPAKLLVLSDGSGAFGRIPWSVLTWPGAVEPLLDTTPVAMAILGDKAESAGVDGAQRVDVLVAAQSAAPSQLAALSDAGIEPSLIAQSVRSRTVSTHAGNDVDLATLATVLGRDRAWVHLSAHGSAQPNRLGYSGIWLNATAAGQTPRFLSWLDLLGLRVNADLVVLNACQLAARGDRVAVNLSFADAVAQAGAHQVIASLWQVSDAATMLWDPAFYHAIDTDPEHNAAAALRSAQLRLRQSRAFAHPFYWAGMQAMVRLELGDNTAGAGK